MTAPVPCPQCSKLREANERAVRRLHEAYTLVRDEGQRLGERRAAKLLRLLTNGDIYVPPAVENTDQVDHLRVVAEAARRFVEVDRTRGPGPESEGRYDVWALRWEKKRLALVAAVDAWEVDGR